MFLFYIQNGERTINFDSFYKSYEKNYLLRRNNKKIHANMTLPISNGLFFYRSESLWNRLPNKLVTCEKVEKNLVTNLKKSI